MSANTDVDSELWRQFYKLETQLNEKLRNITTPLEISYIYNPVEYAADLHQAYLKKYLKGGKKVLFIGLNPGPNGMGQTGIPFGNITTVRDKMGLNGTVNQPPNIHPKRPVNGLATTIEEPSGKRLWTKFQELSDGSLDIFFEQCFVYNFCPLLFYNSKGDYISPQKLKAPYNRQISNACLHTIEQILELIQPEVIVAIGRYAYDNLKAVKYCIEKRLLYLRHPSPRACTKNWSKIADEFFKNENLLKYFRITEQNKHKLMKSATLEHIEGKLCC
ncbi:hypothetical protein FF38_10666 [Lucilia cuprina]|uniref:Uracil-DNA glycosylase-like domain-containing protein n=1 Tax=Lucilia cuprina TaxID=7375 RepID=A0A0L0CG11_LUCCU|nr:Single-strand selective monofunctional uracil-DNA glycosylase [Lucilia cuprina]KNC30409.1 hypothetical protein FF38_10666 [Lucilia cuprina]